MSRIVVDPRPCPTRPTCAAPGPAHGVSAYFDVVLSDGTLERVEDAHAYCQEQSMTTFFRNDDGRQAVTSWSVRVASFRTDRIVAVRRHERSGEVRHLQSV